MDVTWHITPRWHGRLKRCDRPRLQPPAAAARIARSFRPLSIGSFVRPIADRTLATFKRLAESRTRRDVDARRGRRVPAGGLDHRHGPDHVDRHWKRPVLGRPARGRSAVKRIDRFDPEPIPLAGRRADRRLRADRLHGRQDGAPDGPLQPVRAGRGPDGDRRRGADRRCPRGARADRFAVYIGSALGGIAYAEIQHERFMERGIRSVAPNLALAVFGGAAPANLGIALGLHGPILSTANSCAAGAVALGEAFRLIRAGGADAALAGGVEVPLSPFAFGAFDVIRALSSHHNDTPASAARPFDTERDGFVMGEAAALLVLESAEVAQRRGAMPYAELRGYGATSDAFHMVQPRPDGRQSARAARHRHGRRRHEGQSRSTTSMPTHRRRRWATGSRPTAIARALWGRASRTVPVSGTKAYYGHPLGASGAIEAAIAALAISRGWAPGTVNLDASGSRRPRHCPGCCREPLEAQHTWRALDLVRFRRPERRADFLGGRWLTRAASGRGRARQAARHRARRRRARRLAQRAEGRRRLQRLRPADHSDPA